MPKGKKIGLIALSVVLAIALLLGIFYLVSPRTFLQLFLSDSKYSAVVISKNAAKIKDIKALDGEGKLSVESNISLLTGSNARSAVEKYVEALDISINTNIDGNKSLSIFDISDSAGSVLTLNYYADEDNQYVKIDQIDLPWQDITKKEETKNTSSAEAKESESTPTDFENNISVEKDKIYIKLSVDEIKNGVSYDFIPDDFKNKIEDAINTISTAFEKFEIDTVSIELTVNNRNKIEEAKIILKGEKNSLESLILFNKEDCDVTVDFNVEEYGSGTITLKLKEGEFTPFEKPTDVETFDKDKLKSALLSYVMGDLAKNHPDFSNLYKEIFSSVIKDVFSEFIGGITGSSSLEGISEDVGGFVSGILSQFGFGER